MYNKITNSFLKLKEWCEKENFSGWDPYDGLNSRLFQAIPILSNNRILRLVWIQLIKHLPINLRPLLKIDKSYNPKALGLFISGYSNLFEITKDDKYYQVIKSLKGELIKLSSRGYSGNCWGYNFDWQAKAFFFPKYTPTIVATSFISNSLVDAYELFEEEIFLKIARSACDFILNDLNRSYDRNGSFAFSYSPIDYSVIYNASLLGSRLLARVYSYTNEQSLFDAAKDSVHFCSQHQNEDGSWNYGMARHHKWIDNFHTGYNLECIFDYMKYSNDNTFEVNFEKGLEYYLNTFFTSEGISRYYNNSLYPIDIHSPSQLIITLSKIENLEENKELLEKVVNWTIDNMQSDTGYFYYRKGEFYTNKIPYMRWAQAWMFYALSEYLAKENRTRNLNLA